MAGGRKSALRIPPVAETDEFLQSNARYAEGFALRGLDARPSRKLAVVTCMDCRIDVEGALGLEVGQAHVIRNAGGIVSDDVIRSLAISQRRLETEEIVLIQHTGCGMLKISDDGFRAELQDATGVAPTFAIESFTDLDANVRQSLERLRSSPFLAHRDRIRGFVYDVDSGALRELG